MEDDVDREQFVRAVKAGTSDASARGTASWLTKPPGRQPAPRKVELSAWFNRLSEEDRAKVKEIAREAAELAVFNFLSLLDGMWFVDEGEDKGRLELYYVRGEERILLNEWKREYLHDLYNWCTEKSAT